MKAHVDRAGPTDAAFKRGLPDSEGGRGELPDEAQRRRGRATRDDRQFGDRLKD
ncbi:hypothetical protein [Methylobacterium sp.]|uniref:hypothetical protein n=1 Tax=Methylobacterium sp. TaxID=409 RepID=UPI00257F67AE|nr:hypothetical protein [Methylobacterium sp.]